MEAILAILFVIGLAAIVLVGSLALDVSYRARTDHRDREE